MQTANIPLGTFCTAVISVASQIFVNCDGTKSVNQICQNLCEEYSNIDPNIIEEDVSRFINYLVKEDLLFLI